ncbi:MAG: Mrp/NBP35 family ATP-binding protein [Dysgonamonadaceae bacterium]|nr:Mrp/NBP35 family ATP-binding protein [Dysgonamonadaceae bacterium]
MNNENISNDSIISPEKIISALQKVRYPKTGKNIVEMGMIGNDLSIEGNQVKFSLVFEQEHDPFIKSLVKSAEAVILTFVGENVDIKGNIDVKINKTKTGQADLLSEVKNIIAVASCKGGVGKSTVAANLAVALAAQGARVGLLDADVFGPSVPKMFGVENESPYMEKTGGKDMILPVEKYGVKLMSMGFFVNPDNVVVWRGTIASNAMKQMIADTLWGALDYLLIDLPPGTGDIPLTLVQTLAVTGAVIVTTPQEVALADVRKGIKMFTGERIRVPILGLVENMAWFTPAELPENRYYIFGRDGGKRLSEELSIPLLGSIPIVQSICDGGDTGIPVATEQTLTGEAFRKLAQVLIKHVNFRNKHLNATQRVEVKI